jgi:ectoine hydroxylase-related dioxygenase (phytanoyl-CoA dioxygenase family)
MSLITDSDREFFERNGYLKLEGVVPEDACERVVDAIYEFTGRDPEDRSTWHDPPEGLDEQFSGAGMIELYHHPAMWAIRQAPALYQAYAELLGEERLWTSIDRVNMTPPRDDDHPELDQSFVHWDTDTSPLPDRPVQSHGTERVPFGIQGVVYLRDTSEDQGGFQCVPSLFADLEEWVAERPDDRDPYEPDFDESEYPIEAVPGEQGDVVLWNRLLPHGNGHNLADEPRFAQYVLMYPESFADRETREERVRGFEAKEPPAGDPFPGDPREREKEHEVPELTPLGRKLLGADPWTGWLA